MQCFVLVYYFIAHVIFIYMWHKLRCLCSLYTNSNVIISILQVRRLKLRKVKALTPYCKGGEWFSEADKPLTPSNPHVQPLESNA